MAWIGARTLSWRRSGINDPGCTKVRLKVDLPVQQQWTQNKTDKVVNLKHTPYVAHYIPLSKDSQSAIPASKAFAASFFQLGGKKTQHICYTGGRNWSSLEAKTWKGWCFRWSHRSQCWTPCCFSQIVVEGCSIRAWQKSISKLAVLLNVQRIITVSLNCFENDLLFAKPWFGEDG